MATAKSSDIVVIGGGLIGSSIAWRLAQHGHTVTLIERDRPARGATMAAAGMLSPLGEHHPPEFTVIARASLDLFPAFVSEVTRATGESIEYTQAGKLDVAFSAAEAAALRANYGGHDVDWLTTDEVLRREPAVNQSVVSAARLKNDALVDNRRLGPLVSSAAVESGVRIVIGSAKGVIHNNRIQGVTLHNGERLLCDTVIVAAGAWSAELAGLPRALPVVPVRGQMIALHQHPRPFAHMLQSPRSYLIPRSGGRILVGATVERVGFDARTTVAGIQSLLDAAVELVPELRTADVVETWTGFRPGTSDDLPILGADPDVAGLIYATGHFRNGILLAPITAQLIAELVSTQRTSLPIDRFRPDRFAS